MTHGNSGYDMVYYELNAGSGTIAMDRIIVEVGTTNGGPWLPVFYWGDNVPDTNSNVAAFASDGDGEQGGETIPMSALYGTGGLQTGIAIDIDARVPGGTYPWVRLSVPASPCNMNTEIDSVQALP